VKWTLILIGAAIVLLFGIDYCARRDPAPKIPPKVQRSIDSLDVTRQAFNDHRDTVILRAATETVTAVRYVVASADVERRARSSARRADSLAALGTVWHEAYDARTAQVVELDSALTLKDSAWRSERASRISYQSLYADDTLRRVAIERVNGDLRAAIGKLDRPCRVLGISCPSRTAVAIGGAVLGAFVARATAVR
jgi:hypothetical protein